MEHEKNTMAPHNINDNKIYFLCKELKNIEGYNVLYEPILSFYDENTSFIACNDLLTLQREYIDFYKDELNIENLFIIDVDYSIYSNLIKNVDERVNEINETVKDASNKVNSALKKKNISINCNVLNSIIITSINNFEHYDYAINEKRELVRISV